MSITGDLLYERILAQSHTFHPVVDFDPVKEKLLKVDFSKSNREIDTVDINSIAPLSSFINNKLKTAGAKFGIGGYNEDRNLYNKLDLFDAKNIHASKDDKTHGPVNRSIHLGIDIWGEAGTKVYAPLGGMVHSFAFNNNAGDYGATLILLHQLDTVTFYTLYGHLSLEDIEKVSEFQYIIRGQVIGHFGKPEENGNWPPHLHFQVIKDMRMYKGDYPGVCSLQERKQYLDNCPDPDAILQMMKYLSK